MNYPHSPLRRLRVVGTAAALVLAVILVQLTAAPRVGAAAAPPLLSLGKSATASTVENPTQDATKAFDGDPATRWGSNFADNQWITVDLGMPQAISRVVLRWEAAYARGYQIRLSADRTTWTTAYATTTGTGGTETLDFTGTGRYVQLNATTRATPYGVSLWEFSVYGVAGAECTVGNGAGTTATASSTENAAMPPANAVDANLNTRWTSNWTDDEWLRVDLRQVRHICQLSLAWEAAYGKAYQIRVSTDATTWTTAYTTTTGTGGTELVTMAADARYIELHGTQRGTAWGYSLWDLQVNPDLSGAYPVPAGMWLKWEDDFNAAANTPPNPTYWHSEDSAWQYSGEQEYYSPKNAFHDGQGNLILEARREATPGKMCTDDTRQGKEPCKFTSARLWTEGLMTATHGRVESRIKVAGGQGLWPSIWMMGNNADPWPARGEIDIMEHVGYLPAVSHGGVHGPSKQDATQAYSVGGSYTSPTNTDFANDFHVYGVQWTDQSFTFYIDGIAWQTKDRAAVTAVGPWVFDGPFYLLLNNAVGGNWPGAPDATTVFPARMSVDWVRILEPVS